MIKCLFSDWIAYNASHQKRSQTQVLLTNIHILSGFLMSRWKIAWIRLTKLHRGTQSYSHCAFKGMWLMAENISSVCFTRRQSLFSLVLLNEHLIVEGDDSLRALPLQEHSHQAPASLWEQNTPVWMQFTATQGRWADAPLQKTSLFGIIILRAGNLGSTHCILSQQGSIQHLIQAHCCLASRRLNTALKITSNLISLFSMCLRCADPTPWDY